jgi:hypothetical protein
MRHQAEIHSLAFKRKWRQIFVGDGLQGWASVLILPVMVRLEDHMGRLLPPEGL